MVKVDFGIVCIDGNAGFSAQNMMDVIIRNFDPSYVLGRNAHTVKSGNLTIEDACVIPTDFNAAGQIGRLIVNIIPRIGSLENDTHHGSAFFQYHNDVGIGCHLNHAAFIAGFPTETGQGNTGRNFHFILDFTNCILLSRLRSGGNAGLKYRFIPSGVTGLNKVGHIDDYIIRNADDIPAFGFL